MKKDMVVNYANDLRPITLLPIPGKIVEKLIHDQIKAFYEGTSYFTEAQNGFTKNKSTTNALSILLDDVLRAMAQGCATLALFLDFKKAFDTINHAILLEKLARSGVGPRGVSLIKNYLDNRQQRTTINGQVSSLREIVTGVPQGSSLGPLLFLIYINDLPHALSDTGTILFADDTVLYSSGTDR